MRRWKAEDWLQWQQENWGGAEMPIDPPAPVKTGAANRLTKVAVQQWLDRPFAGLRGVLIAADSLQQQWDVQKRVANRKAWREGFAERKQKPEWPKGSDARNHGYWKWMEMRATNHIRLAEMQRDEALRAAAEQQREIEYAHDTHPWAGKQKLRDAFEARRYNWRNASVWRSVVYACWRTKRPGVEAWPMWMRPQQGGQKGKPRVYPDVKEPCDDGHPQGRNRRLREVFEGLPSIAEQHAAIEAITVATGSAPAWMVPRLVDPPKRSGRPRKQREEKA